MKKELEIKCFEVSPEETEDVVFVRGANGKLVKVEVNDDESDN